MSKYAPNASAGFTMTELVTVMAIVAILAGIGIPSFKYVTTSNRISSEINGLLGDMQFARSESIKQGLPVTVCSSTDGANCNGGNTWQVGWIVFLDSNPAGTTGTRDAGEAILRTQNGFKSTDTLVPAAGNLSRVTFNRLGYGATGNAGTVTLHLHDSTAGAQWTRCLAITPVGMLSTQRAATGNCT
jgi:type IV fimbrial biogenesis protein FimT